MYHRYELYLYVIYYVCIVQKYINALKHTAKPQPPGSSHLGVTHLIVLRIDYFHPSL